MGKVVLPIMSAEVRGSLANAITFTRRYGKNIVKKKIFTNASNTVLQAASRLLVKHASVAWRTGATVGGVQINTAYKTAFNEAAVGQNMSGFNLFIKRVVALNGGSEYDESLAIPAGPNA